MFFIQFSIFLWERITFILCKYHKFYNATTSCCYNDDIMMFTNCLVLCGLLFPCLVGVCGICHGFFIVVMKIFMFLLKGIKKTVTDARM